MSNLRTTMTWEDASGDEQSACVSVEYTFHRGYPDTWEEPGCDTFVEINIISGMHPDVPARFYNDDDLRAECMEDYLDREESAREHAADMRAEDLRNEKL